MQKRIKSLLSLPEWTQPRLAKEIGVSVRTVGAWVSDNERDQRNPNKWVKPILEKILDEAGVWIDNI